MTHLEEYWRRGNYTKTNIKKKFINKYSFFYSNIIDLSLRTQQQLFLGILLEVIFQILLGHFEHVIEVLQGHLEVVVKVVFGGYRKGHRVLLQLLR